MNALSLVSLVRWRINLFYWFAAPGARVTRISPDWREVDLQLRLNWRNRNYVGTIFGGTLYSALDPIYMLMLIRNLGSDYVVWDKAATITFKKPGRGTLYARFRLTQEQLHEIRSALEWQRSIDRILTVDLTDAEGTVHVTAEKVIYLRKKQAAAGSDASS
jgi:acyl-coenzyme A thioesterase PaaI-like protein